MTETSRCCCKCCLRLIGTLGVMSLVVWLSLRADDPKCSIQSFYLPALNKTLNSTTNHTFYFELKLENGNKDKGIYYDPLKLTFYDDSNSSRRRPLGECTVPGFYQGHQRKARKPGAAELNKTMLSRAILPNRSAFFLVNLKTAVQFKNIVWKWRTKKHRLVVEANVLVEDNQVSKVNKKGIKLKSGAPERGYCYRRQVGSLVSLMVLVLLNFQ